MILIVDDVSYLIMIIILKNVIGNAAYDAGCNVQCDL